MNLTLNKIPDTEEFKLPVSALNFSGLSGEEKLELYFEKDILAVVKKKLTARDIIGAITSLQEIAAELVKQLVLASGKAEESNGCDRKCDYAKTCDLSIPPCLLAEAGIPFDQPLLAYVEEGAIVIKGEEENPLANEIPNDLLQVLLKANVNADGLYQLLVRNTVIYGR